MVHVHMQTSLKCYCFWIHISVHELFVHSQLLVHQHSVHIHTEIYDVHVNPQTITYAFCVHRQTFSVSDFIFYKITVQSMHVSVFVMRASTEVCALSRHMSALVHILEHLYISVHNT